MTRSRGSALFHFAHGQIRHYASWAMVAFVSIPMLAGCGGGDDAEAETKSDEEAAAPAAASSSAAPVSKPKPKPKPEVVAQKPKPKPKPMKPPRSKDYAAWKDSDYKEAVRERDQAVVGAIAWLAENKKKDDHSAVLITELLALANEAPLEAPMIEKKAPARSTGGQLGNIPAASQGGGGGASRRSRGRKNVVPPTGGPAAAGGSIGGGSKAEPKKQAPAGDGGSGADAPGLDAPPSGGGVGYNDSNFNKRLTGILVADLETFLLTSSVSFAQQRGNSGNPYGDNYPGGNSGQDERRENSGNPYGDNYPGGDSGQREGQENSGNPYGGSYPDGNSGQGERRENSGNPYGGGGGDGMSRGGGPANSGGGIGGSAGQERDPRYAHWGTLNMDEFVNGSVDALFQIDTPTAWETIGSLLAEGMTIPVDKTVTSDKILAMLLNTYGGPGHPTHTLLTGLVDQKTPKSEKAMELFTSYALSSFDYLLGSSSGAAAGAAKRPARSPLGGAPSGGPAFSGASSGGGAGAPGLGGGAGAPSLGGGAGAPGLGGGGAPRNSAPARSVPSISMYTQTRPVKKDEIKRVLGFLWNPEFSQSLAAKLGRSGSLHDQPQLLALTGAIPSQRIRQTYLQLMSNNYNDGPAALQKAGFFSNVVRDPGMLVVLKSLPKSKKDIKEEWREATKEAVLALRDRLRKSATVGTRGRRVSSHRAIPLKIHSKSATVVAGFHTAWPKDLSPVVDVQPTGGVEVIYARLESPINKALLSHYQRQTRADKKADPLDKQRAIYWYSGIKTPPTKVGKMSVDVIISRGAPTAGGGAAAGGPTGGPSLGGGGSVGGGRNSSGAGANAVIEVIIVKAPDVRGSGGLGDAVSVK